ncbi:type IV pilus biogenesis/stability protein PilW [Pasteurellaceae bacterium LIM206]|nr:type IV pilus biogenesis/stability protein PilW [Pasteurellaceae bacterium LIM206]
MLVKTLFGKTQKNSTALCSLIFAISLLTACSGRPMLSSAEKEKQAAAKARVELALGYLARHDAPQAKQNLDKAMAHDPDYYLVHSALAYYYQTQGDNEQAKRAYQTAIKLDPRQGDLYNNYGTFLCTQGEFDSAYAAFNQAVTTPHYYQQAVSYENLALCALAEHNQTVYQKAMAQLEKIEPARAFQIKSLKKEWN